MELEGGTNIYSMQVPPGINGRKFSEHLATKYFIRMPGPGKNGDIKITVNETLMYRDAGYISDAIKDAATIAG